MSYLCHFIHAHLPIFASKLYPPPVLPKLKQQWVRKVEWQIKQVIPLIEKSQINDVLESPPFACAGISELRFVFYPKGIDENHKQWCGLYLRCADENVFIKYTLSVGNAKKNFEHFFNTRGEVYGKTRFAVLESQVESKRGSGVASSGVVCAVCCGLGSG